ncbi:2-oxo acid dehydrogenase subunit E2 [Streptosporangium saharense]|uniref:Dihydrolipoamide acetyltransferase component of pyruvate dehydrogenase complex n=1 Tax=Streptosporangium saharense TaxID=1706840 RepID=A0A7W7QRG8_9ACTN|nr:2-oxo acid dehydrogenase subunit E2 [Streptosporangium saharense]MBB4918244.1 2-oxoglutarate dehydrogenase E2 component (dihydrolipoamide succinyltransferase) [Streptosporangium saharense]
MADIRVPKLNNNDSEYLVVAWLVEDGKPVRAGEPVVVLETSKAADELEAEESGYLHHDAALNTWVTPGALLARITEGPQAAPAPAPAPEAAPAGTSAPRDAVITEPARALIAELGITPEQVASLGLGVVRRADVERLAGAVPEQEQPAVPQETNRHVLSRVQRAVARAVTTSHSTIPAAYTVVKFDVGPALARTKDLSRQVRRPVGLAELFVQAVATLHPTFPLFFAAVDGDGARLSDAPRVGVTFDMGEGLYVPVVRETGTLRDIADTLMRYRLAAAEGDFRERDLTGANIAVTLHTDADVVLAVPFVFPGTVCALAITSPQPELALGEDGAVTTRTVANIGLAYDHRLINGRDAALFLAALRMELQ